MTTMTDTAHRQAHNNDDRPATDRPYCRRCRNRGFYWDSPDEAHRPVWVRCGCPAGDPELDE